MNRNIAKIDGTVEQFRAFWSAHPNLRFSEAACHFVEQGDAGELSMDEMAERVVDHREALDRVRRSVVLLEAKYDDCLMEALATLRRRKHLLRCAC